MVGQILCATESFPPEISGNNGLDGRTRNDPEDRHHGKRQDLASVAEQNDPVQRIGHGRRERKRLHAPAVRRKISLSEYCIALFTKFSSMIKPLK